MKTEITINGVALSEGEKAALWTAVAQFATEMATDETVRHLVGVELADTYVARITAVMKLWQEGKR